MEDCAAKAMRRGDSLDSYTTKPIRRSSDSRAHELCRPGRFEGAPRTVDLPATGHAIDWLSVRRTKELYAAARRFRSLGAVAKPLSGLIVVTLQALSSGGNPSVRRT